MRTATLIIFLIVVSLQKISSALIVIPLVGLLYGFLQYFNLKYGITLSRFWNQNKLLLTFLAIVVLGIFRTNTISNIFLSYYLAFVLFFFVIVYYGIAFYYMNKNVIWSKKEIILSKIIVYIIILPFAFFCLLNLLLYFFGINFSSTSSDEDYFVPTAVLLNNLFGIQVNRVLFPLAGGINAYSVYIGAVFCISLLAFIYFKTHRRIVFFSLIIFLTTLILTDSRGALLYPVLISLFIYYLKAKGKYRNWFKYITFFIILGPILYTGFLPLLAKVSWLNFLSRGDDDIATGNARFFIWAVCAKEFSAFKLKHLFGYGEYGHYGSGASKIWAAGSTRFEYPELALSPHNTMFSILFDYGYIGLIVYLALIWQLFIRLKIIWEKSPNIAYPFFGFMLYNIIGGITESFGGAYLYNYMLLFIMAALIINIKFYLLKKESSFDRQYLQKTHFLTSL